MRAARSPTPRRSLIKLSRNVGILYDLLTTRDHPATARDLHDQLRTAGSRIGLSTIYRNLHTLAEATTVHQFRTGDETSYLACPPEPHEHLICRGCGRVQRQPLTKATTNPRATSRLGFTATEHRVEHYGLCQDCTSHH